jgi:acetyl-CoA acetyltransferase
MSNAVIVDAVRTPVGRAVKGSLKDVRADDLAAIPLRALLERNPQLDPATIVDVMMGAASGEGEQGYNVARNALLLAGYPVSVPGTTEEKLAQLRPAFKPDGTVTAGNACPLNDGAAAVLVMAEEKAAELGMTPKARIVASAVASIEPEYMGLGPIPAVRNVLAQAGMTMADIDVVEINEAFAAQVVPCQEEWGIADEKLNPFGGAIALGHPFGMTGARIMTTLLNDLETLDKSVGLETMCVAGGMGMAMVIERLN